MKKFLPFILLLCACASQQVQQRSGKIPEGTQPESAIIADFESHPNNMNGDVGVYGDGEPDWGRVTIPHSWYYDQKSADFDAGNVYSGQQSFLLVNGEKGTTNGWASFSMNLGPVTDKDTMPITIQSLNVSSFQKLVFMVKGAKGGEKFNVIFRDSSAKDYMPQARVSPLPDGAPSQWTKAEIPLTKIAWQVDLKNLTSIGIEYGINVGNRQGTMIFIDDFRLEK